MKSSKFMVLDLSSPDLHENALLELSKVCVLVILLFSLLRCQFEDAVFNYVVSQLRNVKILFEFVILKYVCVGLINFSFNLEIVDDNRGKRRYVFNIIEIVCISVCLK
ncbi:hypothetical protein Hanom_Chr00s000233g01630011 [Helianthus anomalus]